MPRKPKAASGVRADPTPSPALALQLAQSAGLVTRLSPGRLSKDFPQQMPGLPIIMPPSDPEGQWEFYRADERSLRRFPVHQILDWMVDLSSDVSRALWNQLRICNPSWTCKCFKPGTEQPDPDAQSTLQAFWDLLSEIYGSPDILWNEMFTQAFMRGAFFTELVLDANAFYAVDIALPDPITARFKRIEDPVRGAVWQLGQWQFGGFTPLVRPTIRYTPIDKMPGNPYGRPMVSPALFPNLFLLTLLHDLRRVVGQQGYPRIDVSIDLTALMTMMPQEVRLAPAKQQEWIDDVIGKIRDEYATLEPDDAFVHTSALNVNRPVGTVDASSLGGVQAIFNVLERQSVRALKEMPIMMALSDTSSETNANRQWEIKAAGTHSLQHLAEGQIERLCRLVLRAQGKQATVVFRFDQLRAAEALRDAQTEKLVMSNQAFAYDRGWNSQEQSSLIATGHAPDQPEPRVFQTTDQPAPGELTPESGTGTPDPAELPNVNPEPGADRHLQLVGVG